MTFTRAEVAPAEPEVGAVWRNPDRQWFVWSGAEWRPLVDWRAMTEGVSA